MPEKARNLDQPIQACTSVETNEDISLIQDALTRLYKGCEKHSKELIESRNISNKLKDEHKELRSECDALAQENLLLNDEKNTYQVDLDKATEQLSEQASKAQELEQQLVATQAELAESKETQKNIAQKLEEQAKELGQQAKENHDLNLMLLEKQNQHLAFERSARRKMSELAEDSKTLKEMRKMLGQESAPKAHAPVASNDTNATIIDPASMEDSFEQWLNPPGSKDFNLIDEITQ